MAENKKSLTQHLKEYLPQWHIEKRAKDGVTIKEVIQYQLNSLVLVMMIDQTNFLLKYYLF